MRGERGAPTQTLQSVPVPDTFREISARYYSMLLSFLSVLVPRTFESKAGSLRRSAGGSIIIFWACNATVQPRFSQSYPGQFHFGLRIERGGQLRNAEGQQNQSKFLSQSPMGPQKKKNVGGASLEPNRIWRRNDLHAFGMSGTTASLGR